MSMSTDNVWTILLPVMIASALSILSLWLISTGGRKKVQRGFIHFFGITQCLAVWTLLILGFVFMNGAFMILGVLLMPSAFGMIRTSWLLGYEYNPNGGNYSEKTENALSFFSPLLIFLKILSIVLVVIAFYLEGSAELEEKSKEEYNIVLEDGKRIKQRGGLGGDFVDKDGNRYERDYSKIIGDYYRKIDD